MLVYVALFGEGSNGIQVVGRLSLAQHKWNGNMGACIWPSMRNLQQGFEALCLLSTYEADCGTCQAKLSTLAEVWQ